MTHEEDKKKQQQQVQQLDHFLKEDEGDGLLLLNASSSASSSSSSHHHRIFENLEENNIMANNSSNNDVIMPSSSTLSSSSSSSSVESKVSFSTTTDDCSSSYAQQVPGGPAGPDSGVPPPPGADVIMTGKNNTRHHHLLYHSTYNSNNNPPSSSSYSSNNSFPSAPRSILTPSSSSSSRHEQQQKEEISAFSSKFSSFSSTNPPEQQQQKGGIIINHLGSPHANSRYTIDRIRQRSQNMYSPCSELRFGPKGTLLDNNKLVTIPDQTGQKLKWIEYPQTVLVLKKSFGDNMSEPFVDVLMWLICEKKMKVFVESKVVVQGERYELIKDQLQIFNQDKDDLTDRIDFVICLGGDGTLMYAASLFQKCVPPVMSFHFGSLGFLAPFQFRDFKDDITQVLEGNSSLLLRSRLECTVCKLNPDGTQSEWKNILVLNEVVMDRGLSPYLCNLDLYVEKHLVTSIQGDGVIISTPTGSTAYAVAAGASMMHPSVPSIMITPICPHSLSFRPIVVPAEVEIKLIVSKESRNTAWVSFDGRSRQELQIGDCVKIKTAVHPFPSICLKDPIDDWFNSLAECLHWNMRKLQHGPSTTTSTTSLDSDDYGHNHCT